MSNVVYTRLGTHKGKKRLWLEGTRLANQGIEPGMGYRLESDPDKKTVCLVIEKDGLGQRVVSRRKRGERQLPVIDLRTDDLAVLGEAERLRVIIKRDRIFVTIHHRTAAERERFERLVRKVNDGEPLSVGSLAHGGGILDHAIHQGLNESGVGCQLGFAVEIEKAYLDASQENNPVWHEHSIGIEAPMEDVEVGKLPAIEILCAGLPCTGASLSGRAKNRLKMAEQHETAGPLFVAFLNVIQATQPSVVVLENVPPYQNTASMAVIRSVMENLGYSIHEEVLNGQDFGAIEARERMCMVGLTRGLEGFDFANLTTHEGPKVQLSEILENVPDDDPSWRSFDYLHEKEKRDKAAGKGFTQQILTGDETSVGTLGRGYAKARSTEGRVKNPRTGLQRLFTPKEHARIKTIPEYLIAGLSATRAHEVLGQSVIHAAFKEVGVELGNVLAEHKHAQFPTNQEAVAA